MRDRPGEPRYRSFARALRERHGGSVRRIPVDAGFTCPHIDGTKGVGGCTYCDNRAFSPAEGAAARLSIREQVLAGIERAARARRGSERAGTKFIVYFQPHTNTYAPIARLREAYAQAFVHPAVAGIAVGTRPDAVSAAALDLLESYADRYEVWLELGLQTIHEAALARIHRCDDAENFAAAVDLCRGRRIRIGAHIILGLPGEGTEENRATALFLARLPIHGLKIHNLHVVRGTRLEEEYRRGEVPMLDLDEYVRRACDVLERTRPEVEIQRLAGEAPRDILVAPEWCLRKGRAIAAIQAELERRGSRQGMAVPPDLAPYRPRLPHRPVRHPEETVGEGIVRKGVVGQGFGGERGE